MIGKGHEAYMIRKRPKHVPHKELFGKSRLSYGPATPLEEDEVVLDEE